MDEIKESIRSHIFAEIERQKQDVDRLKKITKPVSPDNAIGRLTRMEAINTKSINEAALRSKTVQLAKLEQALLKVNEPDFGICSHCQEPIPLGRLKLIPESTQCVKCLEGNKVSV